MLNNGSRLRTGTLVFLKTRAVGQGISASPSISDLPNGAESVNNTGIALEEAMLVKLGCESEIHIT